MSAANIGKRRYHAPRRRARAADTRLQILQAALRLLTNQGYLGTTIDAIAAEANVGVRTVYDAFGSKHGLMRGLLDSFSPMSKTDFLARTLAEATDPSAQLQLVVSFVVDYYAAAERFIDVLEANAGADPEIAAMMRMGEELRRESQRDLVRNWATRSLLKPNLSARRAGDILWALTSPHLFRLFVRQLRWSKRTYARWLHETLSQLLFLTP